MPHVRVKENEPFEVAMRRFKRSCEKAGVLAEVRRREFYEKPTCRAQAQEGGRGQAPPEEAVSAKAAAGSARTRPHRPVCPACAGSDHTGARIPCSSAIQAT